MLCPKVLWPLFYRKSFAWWIFHFLSTGLVPAENDHDYFIQLEDSVNKLTAASKDLQNDVFLLFSEEILSPDDKDLKIDPKKLKEDLEKEGLSV